MKNIVEWVRKRKEFNSYKKRWNNEVAKILAEKLIIPSRKGNTPAMIQFFQHPTPENEKAMLDRRRIVEPFSLAFQKYWPDYWASKPEFEVASYTNFARWMIDHHIELVGEYIEKNGLEEEI